MENRLWCFNLCGVAKAGRGLGPHYLLGKPVNQNLQQRGLLLHVYGGARRRPSFSCKTSAERRTFITKLLNYWDRDAVLRLTRERGNISFGNVHVAMFLDFSAEVQKKRAQFVEVK